MLQGEFYTIKKQDSSAGRIETTVTLNSENEIFKGHFPGRPVTPGVVQVRMVKEILSGFTGKHVEFESMGRCKFTKVMDPEKNAEVRIVIDYSEVENGFKVNAEGVNESDESFFKFNANYSIS